MKPGLHVYSTVYTDWQVLFVFHCPILTIMKENLPGLEEKAKLNFLSFLQLPQCSWGSESRAVATAALAGCGWEGAGECADSPPCVPFCQIVPLQALEHQMENVAI